MFDVKKYYSFLESEFFDKPLYYFDTLDSTNTYTLSNDLPDLSVVVAGVQTAGKGRNGHVWNSETSDNIYFSICFKSFPATMLMPLNIVLGYAVCDILRGYVECGLKWPNDILLKNKKIGGILIETLFSGNKLQKAVAGIGINLNTEKFDTKLKDSATSILIEKGLKIPKENFLASLIDNVHTKIRLLMDGSLMIKEVWQNYSLFLNKEITVTVEKGKEYFIEKGINEQGGLIVEDKYGRKREIYSGEVGYDFCG